MSNNNAQLERIKALMTYGKSINESDNRSNYTLALKRTGADGITYGIIKENHKYFIKTAVPGKETIAESYKYIGGWANHKDYEYESYNAATHALEGKLSSINEAYNGHVNIETLDPYKKEDIVLECTDEMKNQIARYRQLFKNTAAIMNESCEIGAERSAEGTVMKKDQNCKGDEAKKGKRGDECVCDKKAKAEPESKGKKTNGVDKKVAPFDEEPKAGKNQIKEGCDGEGCDWASEGMGKGQDPKSIGWDIEGQEKINEEEQDWASEGLPSSAGVGEADSDHNNAPFNEKVNESCNEEGEEEFEEEPEFDEEGEDTFDEEEPEFSEEGEEEFEEEPEFDEEGEDTFDEEEPEFDEEGEEFDDADADFSADDEEGDVDEEDPESLRAEIERLQAKLDAMQGGDEGMEGEPEMGDEEGMEGEPEMGDEEGMDDMPEMDDEEEPEFSGEEDECGSAPMNPMMEAKRAKMNSIVESVVSKILAETELHDFGKHPGYRKKVMDLPATGEDKNQWGEDWNDESVYSEEPFGSKKGSSFPFDEFVKKVTDNVVGQLKTEGTLKKK